MEHQRTIRCPTRISEWDEQQQHIARSQQLSGDSQGMGNVLHCASLLLLLNGPVGHFTTLLDVRTPNDQYEENQTEAGHNGKHHEQGHASGAIDRFRLQRNENVDVTS